MEHPIPEGLPPWMQGVIYIILTGGAAAAAWNGWKRQAKPSDAPNTLIAGDIMDTRPMKELVLAVKDLNDANQHIIEAQDRTTAAVDRAAAATDRNEAAVRALCAAVERGNALGKPVL